MGYTIKIGKLKLSPSEIIKEIANGDRESCMVNFRIEVVPCEGSEPEGLTSEQYTITPGEPKRLPSYTGWGEFMRASPSTTAFKHLINPNSSDGWCYLLNTPDIVNVIIAIEKDIPKMTDENKDRAKWLCFWCKEAIGRYGDEAAIGFW